MHCFHFKFVSNGFLVSCVVFLMNYERGAGVLLFQKASFMQAPSCFPVSFLGGNRPDITVPVDWA